MQSRVAEPRNCQAVSMGYKDDLQRLHAKIDAVSRGLSAKSAPISGWQKAGPIIGACSFLVAVFALYTVHSAGDMKNQVALEVTAQLKEPVGKMGNISSDVAEMKGKLEVLDPLIRELATKHLSEAVSLAPDELISRVPELEKTVSSAKQGGIKLQPSVIKQVGVKLVDVGGKNASSWKAAMDFLAYRSFINQDLSTTPWTTLLPVVDFTVYQTPPTAGPMYNEGKVPIQNAAVYSYLGNKTNVGKEMGDKRLVIKGGLVPLDGFEMRHVTFKGAKITYRGGPTIMEDVLFIDCIFDIVQETPGQNLARSLFSSVTSLDFVRS